MNEDNPRHPSPRNPEWGSSRTPEPVRWSDAGGVWEYGPPRPWVEPRPPSPWADRKRLFRHVLLFVLTVASTWGTAGPVYAAGLMSILLAHEMGHFVFCRRYGVEATLPFFVPFPLFLLRFSGSPWLGFGTFGAVIRMRGPIPSRRALFDIAVAGPLAGLALALPFMILGLRHSHIDPLPPPGTGNVMLGESLLLKFLIRLVLGPVPEGHTVTIHPLGFAAWAGLFVTALNLLPIGQLDGGHIVYSLIGGRSRWVSTGAVAVLAGICLVVFPSFVLLIALLLLIGLRHPPPVDDVTPIGAWRRLLGIVMIIFFVLSFTPVPIGF